MEKYILEQIKFLLETNNNVKNVSMYVNLCGDYVISYDYENTTYFISIDELLKENK